MKLRTQTLHLSDLQPVQGNRLLGHVHFVLPIQVVLNGTPDLSFWVLMQSITMSLNLGLPEELSFPLTWTFFAAFGAGASTAAGATAKFAWSSGTVVHSSLKREYRVID